MDDIIDHSVGLIMSKKRGDRILKGEPICEVHAPSESAASEAKIRLIDAFEIIDDPVRPSPLILDGSS